MEYYLPQFIVVATSFAFLLLFFCFIWRRKIFCDLNLYLHRKIKIRTSIDNERYVLYWKRKIFTSMASMVIPQKIKEAMIHDTWYMYNTNQIESIRCAKAPKYQKSKQWWENWYRYHRSKKMDINHYCLTCILTIQLQMHSEKIYLRTLVLKLIVY